MATVKNVTILLPNGRRQSVKVTPNATILEVLEEVCQKHKYNMDDYELKHFQQILDTNAIIRMTGLSNNAQLEMIPCTKVRLSSLVTIGIQLENGERVLNEFTPTTTLIEILQHMSLDQDLERTALIYLHREIHGYDALKNTTLKSLGLNNGKAILRRLLRDVQISTSRLDTASVISQSDRSIENPDIMNEISKSSCFSKTLDSKSSMQEEAQVSDNLETCSERKETQMERSTELNKPNEISITDNNPSIPQSNKKIIVESCNNYEPNTVHKIKLLGERNAIVFNRELIQALPKEEFPDDFYNLTVDDAKMLLRDAKRRREELEEAPLLTNAQRLLNREKQTLNYLCKYRYTIIRIQFPDQFVLQGMFRPLETVQAIKIFVKNYLEDANSDFVIYTTPPKHILNPDLRLIDENLVPSAIVHYSGSSFLKSDVKQKIVDTKEVEMQTVKDRMSITNEEDQVINKEAGFVNTAKTKSNNNTHDKSPNKNKIPKWFNTHK